MKVNIKTIPDDKLTDLQRLHLQVARELSGNVKVHPAELKNHVKILGAYRSPVGPIYINPERLTKLRWTINTTIHELAHHRSQAGDGTRLHDSYIGKVTHEVTTIAESGKIDDHLTGAMW